MVFSVFMTVGVSVHRYIGVCHPYKSVEWLPKKRVTTLIICLVVFSILFNTTRFFETKEKSRSRKIQTSLKVGNKCFLNEDMEDKPSGNIFFGWAYTIVMYVVPFSLLIILNSLVLSAVRRSRRMHMVSQVGTKRPSKFTVNSIFKEFGIRIY
ncbi:unnamed protein product [Angiostrongylus costaricensis]|uniref:G_PROTEIN_RECEP_F1_2 domain-containing protein n=1 Tax=Angiostrongylus costaricensis TaxID=334426 RepID=A0A0R3PD89_ANGCS|nr:unnamed protein product [Angiostrongylus costaricensis]